MEVRDGHRVLDGDQRALVGGRTVDVALLHAAAEHHDRRAAGEMAVQAVVVHHFEGVGLGARLVACLAAGDAFDHHVAAELAGDDDEGAVEHLSLLEVADQTGDRPVDLLLEFGQGLMAVLVGVPVDEGDVFGGHLDEAGTGFRHAAGEQAAAAEAAVAVGFERFLRLSC